MAKVSVSKTGWWIPESNLDIAAGILGILYPVTFKLFAAKYRNGTHKYFENADGTLLHHHIVVNSRDNIHTANETVWHELIHCVQLERYIAAGKKPADWSRDYERSGYTGAAYLNNPFEIEARDRSAELCAQMILEMW